MKTFTALSTTCLALFATSLSAQEAHPKAEAIAPFVGDEVVAVAHFDLEALAPSAFARRVLEGVLPDEEIKAATEGLESWLAALRDAGGTDLYVLLTPVDLVIPTAWLNRPPAVVVSLDQGTDPEAIAALLSGDRRPSWQVSATVHDAVFAGTPAALDRVGREPPPPRADLFDAFDAAGQGPARLVFIPNETLRRSVEELVPTLPVEFGGGSVTPLTQGLHFATVTLRDQPTPAVSVRVQASDAAAAAQWDRVLRAVLSFSAQSLSRQDRYQAMGEAIATLRPAVEGDLARLEIDLTEATALVGMPILDALEAERRARCTGNLKQIGIALHNYHLRHEAFPPAYSVDENGTPLLSWRVHVLPFIDQESLYEEFRLDEPWDSPHNRRLIAEIPSVFVCPSVSPELASEGKTTYLAPRGEETVFSGPEEKPIHTITDGTSNTIAVLDAHPSQAVIWTKPVDWEVGLEATPADIFGNQHPGGTNATFFDGSVRFLDATLSPSVFRSLLTGRGGEVIRPDDL